MTLPLVLYGGARLRETATPVTEFGDELRQLAAAMIETMRVEEGIGLAAQQVNRLEALCVADVAAIAEPGDTLVLDSRNLPLSLLMPLVLVNPKITEATGPRSAYTEGCLSIPNIRAEVVRPETITVDYQDLAGAPHILVTGGILARCLQHEIDHLNGILFTDRVDPLRMGPIRRQLQRLERTTQG